MKKLLLIDDNEQFSKLLAGLLKEDFQVFFANSINSALKVMEDVAADAICSDYHMTDGTGIDLLQKLRADGCQLPFLLISGSEDDRIILQAKLNGASFCCKASYDLVAEIKKLSEA